MREVVGDLFDAPELVLGHGVNQQGMMGSGIALQFAKRYPEMEENYIEYCNTMFSEEFSSFRSNIFAWSDEDSEKVIFNMFTQELPGANARLDMILASAIEALEIANDLDLGDIALPRIGSGVGGLQWDDVRDMLEVAEGASAHDNEFVIYTPEEN